MIGRTISHYEILDQLGKGGMGEVYVARDTKLKRNVALKILPPEMAEDTERLARFQREAETLASLEHSNIVTVHSVEEAEGRHFFTMSLVEGKTLDRAVEAGKLTLDEFFELAIPITDAVAAAHDKGVTHRDLKPANIMVTEDGLVKVLDFGLAKPAEPADKDSADLATQPLTEDGLVVGTVPYMSTEQLKGEQPDHRADIFSLGVLFYELVTGHRPFRGDTPAELISSILRDDPESVTNLTPEVPHHLSRIIRRCLEKKPRDRFQSTRDLYNELKGLKQEVDSGEVQPVSSTTVSVKAGRKRWVAAAGAILALAIAAWALWQRWTEPSTDQSVPTPGESRQMIVVLPFENQGPPGDEFFSAGITDEITTRLSAVSGLGVISGSTAARYERAQKTSREVGAELGVDYVLEGTVRWAGDTGDARRVRITPRLVRSADDVQVWSEPYDRVIDDIFTVQSDIAEKIIDQLGVSLLNHERRALEAKPTDNVEAYQAYLKGMGYFLRPNIENQRRAIEMFERAAELDPDFALAWAKVAQRSAWLHFQPDLTQDWLAKARTALDNAQALAPEHPNVRLAEGYYYYYGFGEYQRALEAFQAAAEVLPNDAQILAAIGFIHRRQGELEQALGELEQALELDPRNSELILDVASTFRAFRRYEEADRIMDRGISMFPDQPLFYMAKANNLVDWKGSTPEARTVLESAPNRNDLILSWVALEQFDRDFAAALKHLEELPRSTPFEEAMASYHTGSLRLVEGRRDLAQPLLELALPHAEALSASLPDSAYLRSSLGMLYAMLGRKEEAIREGRLAVELSENDSFSGPRWLGGLAAIHTTLGEKDLAIDLLEQLMITPYEEAISITELRFDPFWDPLRDHPRFQTLLDKHR